MEKSIYLFERIDHYKNSPFPISFIAVCLSICSSKQLNIIKGRTGFFHFRGLLMQ